MFRLDVIAIILLSPLGERTGEGGCPEESGCYAGRSDPSPSLSPKGERNVKASIDVTFPTT